MDLEERRIVGRKGAAILGVYFALACAAHQAVAAYIQDDIKQVAAQTGWAIPVSER